MLFFDEVKDDIDFYFWWFEWYVEVQKWKLDIWVVNFSVLLCG